MEKKFIVLILIIFILTSIIPISSGIQTNEYNNNYTQVNSAVYSTTPNWISDNPHYSTGAALADVNQDGWLDYIVADGNDMQKGYLNVYYNDGFGGFPTTSSWHSDDLSYNGHLDVADVNGDGWPDVAVSYLGTGSSLGPIARLYYQCKLEHKSNWRNPWLDKCK